MREKIKLGFELPEVFSFESYDACCRFGISEWCSAINMREYLFRQAKRAEAESDRNIMKDEFFERTFKDCLRHSYYTPSTNSPSLKSNTGDFFGTSVAPIYTGLLGALWNQHVYSSGDSTSVFREELLVGGFPKDEKDKERFSRISNTPIDFLSGLEGSDFVYQTGGDAHVYIDLTAPDEILIEDFQKLLSQYRSKLKLQKPPKKFSQKEFKSWADKNILLYIDLFLLKEINEKKITRPQMGRLLFPDEYNIGLEDRVKNTIEPLAEYLMTESVADALRAQSLATRKKLVSNT